MDKLQKIEKAIRGQVNGLNISTATPQSLFDSCFNGIVIDTNDIQKIFSNFEKKI